jgi:predicted kinase
MVHATPGFVAADGDELTARTFPLFFDVLELLLRAGVTTVAEAAFTDHVWRPRLEPLRGLAQIRVVRCAVDADVAVQRSLRRRTENPLRRAHADPGPGDAAERARRHAAFGPLTLDVPSLDVDTTAGYRPGLADIVAFVNA